MTGTYVIIRSRPQGRRPRIAPSWGLHTTVALLVAVLQRTTHPSASPVSRRVFRRRKVTAWIWEAWPRRTYVGWAGESVDDCCSVRGSAAVDAFIKTAVAGGWMGGVDDMERRDGGNEQVP